MGVRLWVRQPSGGHCRRLGPMAPEIVVPFAAKGERKQVVRYMRHGVGREKRVSEHFLKVAVAFAPLELPAGQMECLVD